jgi:hypothetical protein
MYLLIAVIAKTKRSVVSITMSVKIRWGIRRMSGEATFLDQDPRICLGTGPHPSIVCVRVRRKLEACHCLHVPSSGASIRSLSGLPYMMTDIESEDEHRYDHKTRQKKMIAAKI